MNKESNSSFTENIESFELITSRPEGMPYDEYKMHMRAQKKAIKKYLKGRLIHLSKLYPTAGVMQLLMQDEYKDLAILLEKGHTYIKKKDNESN